MLCIKFTNIKVFVKIFLSKCSNPILLILFINGFILFPVKSGVADVNRPLSVRQIGMGYTIYVDQPDPLLFFSNPVALSSTLNWSVGSFYTRLFNLQDLGLIAITGAKRFGNWTAGLGGSYFGFDYYHEQTIATGLSNTLNDRFAWGFSIRFQQITIKNYGSSGSLVFDAGWKFSVTQQASILGSIQNISRATIGQSNEKLPQTIQVGIQFIPVAGVIAATEVFNELGFEPEARFGVEMELYQSIKVRGGITRNPSRFTGGFSLQIMAGRIDYGFSNHIELGYTHALSVVLIK